MGVCNCCTLRCVHSSIAIILMGKRELVALLNLSSWSLVMGEWLFLAMPWGCLRFVIVVCPDHTHLLFIHIHVMLAQQSSSQFRKLTMILNMTRIFSFTLQFKQEDPGVLDRSPES